MSKAIKNLQAAQKRAMAIRPKVRIVWQSVIIIAIFSGSLFALPNTLSTVPEGVERYARDMDVVMKSSGPISLEPVYTEGLSVAKILVRDQLEHLDDSTYRKVHDRMVGFMVSREEVVVAAPDLDFFLKLAREKGKSADQAYFEVMKKTYPVSIWPAYIDQQTDTSGCTRFDGKTLTGLYGVWDAFQKTHPDHYREPAQKELIGIEKALDSTCACEKEDDVRKELENFLNVHPNSWLVPMVTARLQKIKSRTSEIRFNCKSG